MASTRYTGEDATPRGWILHDRRIAVENLSSADSSYTEASPRAAGAGDPVDATTAAVVELVGDQDTALVLETLNGGLPKLGSGFELGYRRSTDVSTDTLGWQGPHYLTGISCPSFTTTALRSEGLITLPNGKLFQYEWNTTTYALSFRVFDPTTLAWTSLTPVLPGISGTARQKVVAACVDLSGRVLLLVGSPDTTPYDLVLYRSSNVEDNNGWAEIARPDSLKSLLDDTYDRVRLFQMRDGALVVVTIRATSPNGWIRQIASLDGGATWSLVGNSVSNETTNLSEAVQAADGSLLILKVASSGTLTVHRTTSAWTNAAEQTSLSSFSSVVEVWAAADPGGRLYAWYRSTASSENPLLAIYSDDYGATWTTSGRVLATAADADCYPTRGQAAYSMGAAWLLHQSESVGVTTDDSPILLRLGGWQSCMMPRFSGGSSSGESAAWWPIGEPDDLACWTATGSDAADSINSEGRLEITTSVSARYFDQTSVSADRGGHLLEAQIRVTTSTADTIGVRSTLSDGTNGSQVIVYFTATEIKVYENGSLVLTDTNWDLTDNARLQVRIAHKRADWYEIWVRRPSNGIWSKVRYAAIASAAYAASGMRWGHLTTGATVSVWSYVWSVMLPASSVGTYLLGAKNSGNTVQATRLAGHPLTGLGTPLEIAAATTAGEGRRVLYARGADGPAVRGDSWTARPAYEYPIEALHPLTEPSPRRAWRSTSDNNATWIAWSFGSGSDFSSWLSNYVGVAVFGANVETINVQAKVSGSWTTIGTMTLTQGFSGLSWSRSGRVVKPNGTPAGGRYLYRNELVGGYFDFGSGVFGKIVAHTEGIWSTAAGRGVEIEVESYGAAGASGTTGAIRFPAGMRIFRTTTSKPWEGMRLEIPAQQAPSDRYEIGTAVLGQVVAAGQSHSWGATQTYERNAEDTISRDGVPRTRSLGPVARRWEWAWSDGVDQSRLLDASPTPDYLAFSAVNDGIANLNDAPYLIAGLLADAANGEIPVVAVEYMQADTTITDRRLFMLARLAGNVGIEHVQGDFEEDAVLRVSPLSMREIV